MIINVGLIVQYCIYYHVINVGQKCIERETCIDGCKEIEEIVEEVGRDHEDDLGWDGQNQKEVGDGRLAHKSLEFEV